MRRRTRMRALAATLVLAAAVLVTVPASAAAAAPVAPVAGCLCGAVIGDDGTVDTPDAVGIVQWEDGVETLDLAAVPRASTDPIALIVPTPAAAKVTAGDPDDFAALADATRARAIVQDDWWGRAQSTPAERAPDVPAPGKIVSRDIRANDLKAVQAWADDQGLVIDDATAQRLSTYRGSGWVFSLISLDASGTGLDPVRLQFRSTLRLFPMLLAAASEKPASLRLYVGADHRVSLVQHTRSQQPLDAAESVVWAGPTAGTPASSFGAYLTAFDLHLDDPADQVSTDMRIVDAVADVDVQPTRVVVKPITLLGVPLGWLITVWSALGAAIGLVALAARLRAR